MWISSLNPQILFGRHHHYSHFTDRETEVCARVPACCSLVTTHGSLSNLLLTQRLTLAGWRKLVRKSVLYILKHILIYDREHWDLESEGRPNSRRSCVFESQFSHLFNVKIMSWRNKKIRYTLVPWYGVIHSRTSHGY